MSDGHGGHPPQGGPRHLAGPREGRERQRDDRSSRKRSRSPHSPRGPPPPERCGGSSGSWEQHDRRGGSDRPDWRSRGGSRSWEHGGPPRRGPDGDWRAGRGPPGPLQWERARRDDGPRGWGREPSPPPRRGRDRSPDYTDADQGSRRRASPDYKDSGPAARRHEPLPSRDRSSSPGPRRGQPAFVPRNVQQPASLGGSSRPRPRSRSPEGIRGGSGGGSNTQLRGPSGKGELPVVRCFSLFLPLVFFTAGPSARPFDKDSYCLTVPAWPCVSPSAPLLNVWHAGLALGSRA